MDYPKSSFCLGAGALLWLLGGMAMAGPAAPSPFIEKLPPASENTAPPEPDYAVVAADARKIADEIEARLIEGHMEEAAGGLAARDTPVGHARAEEAYLDMKDMIKFCESASGGAGSACKFQLEIKMGMNMGNTLGQLGAGMKPGSSGLSGQGNAGQSGGGQNFGMFGPDKFGEKSNAKSRMLGNRKTKSDAASEEPGGVANNVDEVAAAKKSDVSFEATGGARVLEEYRGHIDGYFRKLAAEEAGP